MIHLKILFLLALLTLIYAQYVVEEVEYIPADYGGNYGGVPPPGYGYGGGYNNYGYGYKPPGIVSSILYSLGLKKKK